MTRAYHDLDQEEWLESFYDLKIAIEHLAIGYTRLGLDYLDRLEQEHLLWFVVNGSVEVAVADERRLVSSGSLLWVNPGNLHHEWHRSRARLIFFRLRTGNDSGIMRYREPLLVTGSSWNIKHELDELIYEQEHPQDFSELKVRALLAKIFTALFRQRSYSSGEHRRRLDYDQINILMRYMREHMHERVTPGDLARQIERSLAYMTPLFKASLGLPPRQWIVQQKMQHAANLLRDSGEAIAEIAETIACSDANLFSRQFKQHFGCSPRAYRRQFQHQQGAAGT